MRQLSVHQVAGSHASIGASHGAAFRDEIQSYLETRIALSIGGTRLGRADAVAVADTMLEAHRRYDEDLFEEMTALALAAGISPAEAVIVGGYTDFIDTLRAVAGSTAVEDTCTAIITPDERSGGAGFLAQTWDMNATATEHVILLDVAPFDAPRSLVFTTHGTVGQIGMNELGIAVGINNLTVSDGTVGVTWPFVVRKALRQTTYAEALACIVDAELAGGHNFLVFDADGNGASVEATPTQTVVSNLGKGPLIHTNHCLHASTQAVEDDRPMELQINSTSRLVDATRLVGDHHEHTESTLMSILRDENSICRHAEPPFDYESSGAVVMRPRTRELWACWGVPSENEFELFEVS